MQSDLNRHRRSSYHLNQNWIQRDGQQDCCGQLVTVTASRQASPREIYKRSGSITAACEVSFATSFRWVTKWQDWSRLTTNVTGWVQLSRCTTGPTEANISSETWHVQGHSCSSSSGNCCWTPCLWFHRAQQKQAVETALQSPDSCWTDSPCAANPCPQQTGQGCSSRTIMNKRISFITHLSEKKFYSILPAWKTLDRPQAINGFYILYPS